MWTKWELTPSRFIDDNVAGIDLQRYFYCRDNGRTVEAKLLTDCGYIRASATCSPYDIFDRVVGEKIAMLRIGKKLIDKRIEDVVKAADKWELAGEICLSYGESAMVYSLHAENETRVKAMYNGKWYQAVAKATNKIDGQNGLFRVALLRLRSQLYAAAADKMEGNEC